MSTFPVGFLRVTDYDGMKRERSTQDQYDRELIDMTNLRNRKASRYLSS